MAGRIVVGVDESAGSRAALGWALSQARSTGAAVDVVGAWQVPTIHHATCPVVVVPTPPG